ncbi:hypothetical protein MTR01_16835 [Burkholderia thailandensis]|uniref:hypothetical protein n=1 Tax=Burkholderia thailandensis TaxID=57975 RepID=UPI0022AC3446|nr:hypothetical protein [Burkholderia thailandensis]MCZ2895689.1 hypothetical protein [Burkholderia thailandensis]
MPEASSPTKRRNRIEVCFSDDELLHLHTLAVRAGASTPGAFVKQSALAARAKSGRNPFALSWVPEYVLRIQQIAMSLEAIASHGNCDLETTEALRRIEAELSAHREYFFCPGGPDGNLPA